MRIIFTLLLGLSLLVACNTVKPSVETKGNYSTLKAKDDWMDYKGKKIVFSGQESKRILQHMMANFFNEERHSYFIDPSEEYKRGQLVVYSKEELDLKAGKEYLFYGEIQTVSGAGKGGGTHTELYIVLDKVEAK